jgi:hypothetical protein
MAFFYLKVVVFSCLVSAQQVNTSPFLDDAKIGFYAGADRLEKAMWDMKVA